MRLLSLVCLVFLACGGEDGPMGGGDAGLPDSATCNLTPRAECCFGDGDCTGTKVRCYTQICTTYGEGRCEELPAPGMCWVDADCDPGKTCQGEQICVCGVACLVPDSPGTCQP